MKTLRANFPTAGSAEAAHRALVDAGVDERHIQRSPVSAVDAIDDENISRTVEVSPDPGVSEGAEGSGGLTVAGVALGSVIGAAVGIVSSPILGPVGIAAGAGVGAYAGSLVGALAGLEPAVPEGTDSEAEQQNAAALTVTTANENDCEQAQKIVQSYGATVVQSGAQN